MNTRTDILELPLEILTGIFQKLELGDRKSVRLSCRKFYDACNQISIISNEKFVLRNVYSFLETTQTLISCQRLRLNIEFQGQWMDWFSGELWKNCGDKIDSLTLYQSPVNDDVLKNVIVYCRNLKYWKIWGNSCSLSNSVTSGMDSTIVFEELVEQKIVHKELETFEMHIDSRDIWASIIEKILLIFPNVKTFGALCWYSPDTTNKFIESPLTLPLFAFTRIDKFLRCTKIERLIFDVPSDGYWLKNSSVWDLRLKEIQTTFYHTERILEMLTDFFSHQKEIEAVCLTVIDIKNKLLKKLLFHIISVCPNLSRLEINYPTDYIIDLNENEFCLLLQKRLEFLKLRFTVINSQPDSTVLKLPMNRNLHTLVIDVPWCVYAADTTTNIDYVLIMEYFQNLKHLEVCWITDAGLQAIIKNHANLEILKLNNIDECSDFAFTGRRATGDLSPSGYSIRQLKNLQCLCLNINWCDEDLITEVSILELSFVKLKRFYLYAGHFTDQTHERLDKIAENLPHLEIFAYDASLDFSQLLSFCKKMKKLYCLSLVDKINDHFDIEKTFLSCPSLRYIVYNYYRAKHIYCFNPFTKTMSVKQLGDLDLQYDILEVISNNDPSWCFSSCCTSY